MHLNARNIINKKIKIFFKKGLTNNSICGILLCVGVMQTIAGVAQLAEQLICNQQVAGSSPITSSRIPVRRNGDFCFSKNTKEICIMNKGEYAEKLFHDGYNCAQAVFGAFCEELDMDLDSAMKLASSFGGGMGRLREVCGAVSGMFMVAGAVKGYSDPRDNNAKMEHYALIQRMAKMFSDKNGTIICRELLNLPEPEGDPTPTERTKEFYAKRPCGELVRIAADIAWQVLFEEK